MNIAYKYLILLLGFQIIDVGTTYYLLNMSWVPEANFIIVFLMKHFNDIFGLSVLKIFAMILLFLYVPMGWVEYVWVRIMIYATSIVYFIVCLINISIIVMEWVK